MPPLLIGTFICVYGLLNADDIDEIAAKLRRDYPTILMNNYKVAHDSSMEINAFDCRSGLAGGANDQFLFYTAAVPVEILSCSLVRFIDICQAFVRELLFAALEYVSVVRHQSEREEKFGRNLKFAISLMMNKLIIFLLLF